jgi:predicted ATPase/class 3 adenylate cyclase
MSETPPRQAPSPESTACPACGFVNPGGFRFCGGCGVALAGGAWDADSASFAQWAAEPERRQLTVLFCDLVDSTALATGMDLEEFRDVIRSFQTACAGEIRRSEGTISRYMGDGMLVLFGYPRAQEDAAERAVQAGLNMVDAIARLPRPASGQPLAIRVGIATGLVVVGDVIGEGSSEEEAVLGETPNLAARLQAFALPNSVVITSRTLSLLGGRFDCEDLGRHPMRGFAAPVPIWRVVAPRAGGSRFHASRSARLAPIIDREEDLAWLMRLWRSASRRQGRAALLGGEAGIGKSRIVEALRERVAGDADASLLLQCSPHYLNRALHPVIQHIENAAGIGPEDSPGTRLDKLAAWLGPEGRAGHALPLLAALLSIPESDRSVLPPMSAQRQKELTFDLLLGVMQSRTPDRALLVVFEDLHWVDPTTLEFLTHLVARIADMAMLTVLTFRNDDLALRLNEPSIERRDLQRLSRQHASELVEQVAGEGRMPRNVVDQLVAKTDGIPLFAEELTRAVLGTGLLGAESGAASARGPLPALAIPSTLHDSLMARLDQLGPEKFIAQIASAIGREFSYPLLEAVAPLPPERLRRGLRALEDAGLVYADPSVVGESYIFKHALVQEVAYQTLLRSRRRELHARIAEVLEERFPQTARIAPELVAHHWTEGGDAPRAVARWLTAGEGASARSANREAIGHLRRGLELVPQLADPAERRTRELELLLALGPALIVAEGAGNPEIARLYSRAIELCSELPESRLHFAARWGWWRASMDHQSGRERADRLMVLAQGLGDSALTLQAHHSEWATLYMLGAHDDCCRHIDAGLALYDAAHHRSHAAIYGGHDAKVCALGERSLACWLLGQIDESLDHVRAALAWAEELAHVGSRVHAMDYALVLHKFRRDALAVARWAAELVSYATEQRLQDHQAKGAFFRGWARASLDDVADGLNEMREALVSEQEAGTPEDFPLYFEMLAEACARVGRFDEGLAAVGEGLAQAERRGLVYWNAELHRRRGELLVAAGGDRAAAVGCFETALDTARGQGARSLELRAATSLVRLRRDASAVLRPVYERFTQGLDTPDLVEARTLLGELA